MNMCLPQYKKVIKKLFVGLYKFLRIYDALNKNRAFTGVKENKMLYNNRKKQKECLIYITKFTIRLHKYYYSPYPHTFPQYKA